MFGITNQKTCHWQLFGMSGKKTSALDEHYRLLLGELAQTKSELDSAYSNFQNVVDPDLIDSCIYEVNAVQLRYKVLLGRVKQIEDSYAKNPLEASRRSV